MVMQNISQELSQDISTTVFEFPNYPRISPTIENLTETGNQCWKILQMDKGDWQQLAGSACPGSMMQVATQENIFKKKLSWNLRRFLIATAKDCFTVLQRNEKDWQQFSLLACPDSIK
ncbi:MAG: hypothetical protein F6J93_14940 [Oscillatoria sp. SIO1A7]|nr:hypothetical protein [Oscillatoria sp. SIO1A7]